MTPFCALLKKVNMGTLHFGPRSVELLDPADFPSGDFVVVLEQRIMKRLLILTAVSLAACSGCNCCGLCGHGGATSVYRPPSCTPACAGGSQAYPAQGIYAAPGGTYAAPNVMAAPTVTVPQAGAGPSYPGPEVYTPAN
jgi:hypothetical protein